MKIHTLLYASAILAVTLQGIAFGQPLSPQGGTHSASDPEGCKDQLNCQACLESVDCTWCGDVTEVNFLKKQLKAEVNGFGRCLPSSDTTTCEATEFGTGAPAISTSDYTSKTVKRTLDRATWKSNPTKYKDFCTAIASPKISYQLRTCSECLATKDTEGQGWIHSTKHLAQCTPPQTIISGVCLADDPEFTDKDDQQLGLSTSFMNETCTSAASPAAPPKATHIVCSAASPYAYHLVVIAVCLSLGHYSAL